MTRRDTYVCGIDAAIDVVGGKWKVLVLWELGGGPRRFGELRRGIPGVTEKVLTSHLRELEADGIVSREEALEGAVRRVTYALTPLGVSLNEALAPLGAWGREHLLGRQGARSGQGGHGGRDEALGRPR
ncbi:winged helix-turn-helix transcriptional regulator [Streptomyces sp. HB2AG]|uniref:winged helix-turn-helix transcriptional regulator n=1 Tax=Streptomyces sp. HB2AG TaxID=2983400 RepID=UPI0022AA5CAF|nr:helix-turn-helix domain-containing protein [Streptomyces sp. HB2AG]MCZ2524002.1 helix-turn-helix domain-containing protein [Streptomyces sp. HB2AG]